jgi:mono/diheme cytochrome c family protein
MNRLSMMLVVAVWSAYVPAQLVKGYDAMTQSAPWLSGTTGAADGVGGQPRPGARAGHYAGSQPPAAPLAAPSGDAKRGKTLFDQTYRCYACHGYEGETGSPRLVPMARSEDAFVAFVRKPPSPAMPAFSDVAPMDLADVYAYLRSLRPSPPPAQSIPLLRDILQQIGQAQP